MTWKTFPTEEARKPRAAIRLFTPKELADLLKVSLSWLAKSRMTGDGPPYIQIGRSVRYPEDAFIQWVRGQQRLSTRQY